MIRPVLVFPDPFLKRVCVDVTGATADRIATDLIDTMRAHPRCIGLAAPQIGEPHRVAVIDVTGHRLTTSSNGLLVLVNPLISMREGHHVAREGCLSLPDITADVNRAERIVVERQNAQLWAEGFEARAIQHELDHLEGILILDRVRSVHALHRRHTSQSRSAGG